MQEFTVLFHRLHLSAHDGPDHQGQGALLQLLGQRRKTFLTGQRAKCPASCHSGWWDWGSLKGADIGLIFVAAVTSPILRLPCPPHFHYSCLEKLDRMSFWVLWVSSFCLLLPLPLPAASIKFLVWMFGLWVLLYHLLSTVSSPWLLFLTAPTGAIWSLVSSLEVLYWWPLSLFPLPLLLVLLSTPLSYLDTKGCLCVCVCVCQCRYFLWSPTHEQTHGYLWLICNKHKHWLFLMFKVKVLLNWLILVEAPWSVTNLI